MGMIPNGGGAAYLSSVEYDPSKVNLPKTYYLNSYAGGHWFFLGTWSSFDAAMCHITVYSGDGYNAEPRQNSIIEGFIKDGLQSDTAQWTDAYGITCDRNQASTSYLKLQIYATSATTCEIWLYCAYDYNASSYTIEMTPGTTYTPVNNCYTSLSTSGIEQHQTQRAPNGQKEYRHFILYAQNWTLTDSSGRKGQRVWCQMIDPSWANNMDSVKTEHSEDAATDEAWTTALSQICAYGWRVDFELNYVTWWTYDAPSTDTPIYISRQVTTTDGGYNG